MKKLLCGLIGVLLFSVVASAGILEQVQEDFGGQEIKTNVNIYYDTFEVYTTKTQYFNMAYLTNPPKRKEPTITMTKDVYGFVNGKIVLLKSYELKTELYTVKEEVMKTKDVWVEKK